MKLLYFNAPTSFKHKIFVVPANPHRKGRSMYRHNDDSLDLGVNWNLSEMLCSGWSNPPLRITRKQAESLMGSRLKFRKLVAKIRSEAFVVRLDLIQTFDKLTV